MISKLTSARSFGKRIDQDTRKTVTDRVPWDEPVETPPPRFAPTSNVGSSIGQGSTKRCCNVTTLLQALHDRTAIQRLPGKVAPRVGSTPYLQQQLFLSHTSLPRAVDGGRKHYSTFTSRETPKPRRRLPHRLCRLCPQRLLPLTSTSQICSP